MVLADDLVAVGIGGKILPRITVVLEQRFLLLAAEVRRIDRTRDPQTAVGDESSHFRIREGILQQFVRIAAIFVVDTSGRGVGAGEQVGMVMVGFTIPKKTPTPRGAGRTATGRGRSIGYPM